MILVKNWLHLIENSNYYQIGNAHVHFELTLQKDGVHVEDDDTDTIRLVNNAFTHLFKEPTLATTGGSENEVKKYVGPVSTIIRVLTSKDGDLSSYFDKINEDHQKQITFTPRQYQLEGAGF